MSKIIKKYYNNISYGFIAYRYKYNELQYLFVQRRNCYGYIDFIKGIYNVNNVDSIIKLLKDMTIEEQESLIYNSNINLYEFFKTVWDNLWLCPNKNNFKKEFEFSFIKYSQVYYLLPELINTYKSNITKTQNWGFPKGKKKSDNEFDFDAAEREFCEETNYIKNTYIIDSNINPKVEQIIGTNNIIYDYKYYVCKMVIDDDPYIDSNNMDQYREIKNIKWFNYKDALDILNEEDEIKKNILNEINSSLTSSSN
jgi:8-oxo-dGTP pyrophosphatase MutT (NUDIX family)